MTIEQFFEHVERNGFCGYAPAKNDIMGDVWAKKIGEEFDRVAASTLENRHVVWMIFQWLYCEIAGMRSRVVASPPAIRASGQKISDSDISLACELLLKSVE